MNEEFKRKINQSTALFLQQKWQKGLRDINHSISVEIDCVSGRGQPSTSVVDETIELSVP